MKKRILSILLAVCLLAGLVPPAVAAATPFSDVAPGAWYADEVRYVYDRGLMDGTGGGRFEPQKGLTRGMFVTVLGRLADVNKAAWPGAGFPDTAAGQWYTPYVRWAADAGIVNGYPDGSFRPNRLVSREEMAAMIARYVTAAELSLPDAPDAAPAFRDADSVSGYARAGLELMRRTGLLRGDSSGRFNPQNTATRAEAATLFMRLDQATRALPRLVLDQTEDFTVRKNRVTLSGSLTPTGEELGLVVCARRAETDPEEEITNCICGADGAWEMTARLKPGRNEFTFSARGAAPQSVAVTYEMGELITPAASEIAYDAGKQLYYANDLLLVLFSGGASQEDIDAAAAAVNGTVAGKTAGLELCQIRVPKAAGTAALQALADRLMAQFPCVTYATYDAAVPGACDNSPTAPNDPWNGDVTTADWTDSTVDGSNWWIEAIEGEHAWTYAADLPAIAVGISDSSFDTGHEDLKGRFTFPTAAAQQRNQKPVVSIDPAETEAYHGTHVAGIIGAQANNGKGIAGVAPNARLLFAPIWMDKNAEDYLWWDSAQYGNLSELVQAGAKVVNFSQGKTNFLTEQHDAYSEELLRREGNLAAAAMARLLEQGYDFVVVQSAGNGLGDSGRAVDARQNGWFASITAQSSTGSARFSAQDVLDRVLIVGAAGQSAGGAAQYECCTFSNYGARVDVCAPGRDVYSTVPGNTFSGFEFTGGYQSLSGTSMAAPIVSGVCALTWAANRSLTGAQVKDIVCATARDLVAPCPNEGDTREYRLVNARLAVERALAVGGLHSSIGGQTVEAGTGAPLAAQITVTTGDGTERRLTSDAETGWFSVSLPAGPYTCRISCPGYTIGGEAVHTVSGTLGENELFTFAEPFEFTKSEPPADRRITGTAVDAATGGALSNVTVYLYDADGNGPLASINTGSGGTFTVPVTDAGAYRLKLLREGYGTAEVSVTVGNAPVSVGTVRLTAAGGSGDFAGGDGTEENPYQIATAAQLSAIRKDLTAHYVLTSDITLSGVWKVIGYYGCGPEEGFTGTLDGAGHTIRGLNIDKTSYDNPNVSGDDGAFGLFADVYGTVRDLTLENVTISIDPTAPEVCIGGVAAYACRASQIENCHVTGSLFARKYYGGHPDGHGGCIGGIVGEVQGGTVRGCSFDGDIHGYTCGGIAGAVTNGSWGTGTVERCVTTGAVYTSYYGGGIAGTNFAIVQDCESAMALGRGEESNIVNPAFLGGIVGNNDRLVRRCFSTGRLEASAIPFVFIGGVVGTNGRRTDVMPEISDCYFAGDIVVTDYEYASEPARYQVGGVCGGNVSTGNGVIRRCYSVGTLQSSAPICTPYGIVDPRNPGTVEGCYYIRGAADGSGTRVTDAQMRQRETFVGFDFDSVWTFTGDYPYPQLRGNLQ